LIVLLAAIALGRVGFGIVLIIVFSLGLAGVLTGIGLLMLHAKNLFARAPMRVSGRLRLALPVLSALFVTLAGAGVTWRALAQVGLF
jgi:ABC-type nickel/cobalt efflux system permease component RcnA